jgi:hypothetical protein
VIILVALLGLMMIIYKAALWYGDNMSIRAAEDEDEEPVVAPVVAIRTAAIQPIVMPNNEYSSKLSDSDRIAFEARAAAIADLYKKGLVTNLSKAICGAFNCSVQAASKPDSTYQQALKAVNKYLPQGAQFAQADGNTAPATYPVSGRRSAS